MKCDVCNVPPAWQVWCEFCERRICQACTRSSDFGHVCESCKSKIETGMIDEHGVEHTGEPDP